MPPNFIMKYFIPHEHISQSGIKVLQKTAANRPTSPSTRDAITVMNSFSDAILKWLEPRTGTKISRARKTQSISKDSVRFVPYWPNCRLITSWFSRSYGPTFCARDVALAFARSRPDWIAFMRFSSLLARISDIVVALQPTDLQNSTATGISWSVGSVVSGSITTW